MYGKGIANDGGFIERALGNLRDFLEADGHELVYRRFIAPSSVTVPFARAQDRRVTGPMNDLIDRAKYMLADGETSPHDARFKLNETPMSVLPSRSGDSHGSPRGVFERLAETVKLAPGG